MALRETVPVLGSMERVAGLAVWAGQHAVAHFGQQRSLQNAETSSMDISRRNSQARLDLAEAEAIMAFKNSRR